MNACASTILTRLRAPTAKPNNSRSTRARAGRPVQGRLRCAWAWRASPHPGHHNVAAAASGSGSIGHRSAITGQSLQGLLPSRTGDKGSAPPATQQVAQRRCAPPAPAAAAPTQVAKRARVKRHVQLAQVLGQALPCSTRSARPSASGCNAARCGLPCLVVPLAAAGRPRPRVARNAVAKGRNTSGYSRPLDLCTVTTLTRWHRSPAASRRASASAPPARPARCSASQRISACSPSSSGAGLLQQFGQVQCRSVSACVRRPPPAGAAARRSHAAGGAAWAARPGAASTCAGSARNCSTRCLPAQRVVVQAVQRRPVQPQQRAGQRGAQQAVVFRLGAGGQPGAAARRRRPRCRRPNPSRTGRRCARHAGQRLAHGARPRCRCSPARRCRRAALAQAAIGLRKTVRLQSDARKPCRAGHGPAVQQPHDLVPRRQVAPRPAAPAPALGARRPACHEAVSAVPSEGPLRFPLPHSQRVGPRACTRTLGNGKAVVRPSACGTGTRPALRAAARPGRSSAFTAATMGLGRAVVGAQRGSGGRRCRGAPRGRCGCRRRGRRRSPAWGRRSAAAARVAACCAATP